jgi:ParB/Sulfiredoxin domain
MLSQVEDELPPILVHQASMRIVDGMHRFRAAILRGDTTIVVRFLDCDENEAFAAAVEMNVKHGLPLSLADRKAAARQILDASPQWSNRMVAAKTGLSHKTVSTLRERASGENSQSDGRMGRDGRFRQLSTAAGREKAADLIRQYPGKSLREIARSAGVSVGTVRDVRLRLDSGLDPVPKFRQSSPEQPDQARPTGAPRVAGAAGIPAEEHPSPDPDVKTILQSLSNDPSLRFSETGRLLIRLLRDSMTFTAGLAAIAENVPPHQAYAIAQLVRSCADSLSGTARQLEQASPR